MVPSPSIRSSLSLACLGLLAACAGPHPTTAPTPAGSTAQPAAPAATPAQPAATPIRAAANPTPAAAGATPAAAAAAEVPARDELIAAFKRLQAAPNYSFRTTFQSTLVMGEAPPFTRSSTNVGQVQNGGPAVLTLTSTSSSGETRTVHSVRLGDRVATESANGTWTVRTRRAPAAADGTPLPRTQLGQFLAEAEHLHNVRREGDAIVGDLPELEPGVAYDQVPKTAVREARYWVRDGMVVKQQLRIHIVARMATYGERKQDQVTTVEYSDVGTTAVTVPPGARTALGL